ncbi:hypothetical protein F4811DRAFT_556983 [Daldinia bambusicola]|nr:hypothetical protein F4811DRAFT_556983 [Daldinia bambusicola]
METLTISAGLVRFIARGGADQVLIGEPTKSNWNIGKAVREGKAVQARVFSGTSVLDAGEPNGTIEIIGRLLSPVSAAEVGTIRGIGLNASLSRRYGPIDGPRSAARETTVLILACMKVPDVPLVFL